MTVLVTGATGTTGRRVAALLESAGADVRRAARSTSPGFDWLEPATHDAAFEGVESLYLLPPLATPDPAPVVAPALERAVRRGLRRVVLLSAAAVERGTPGLGAVQDVVRARPRSRRSCDLRGSPRTCSVTTSPHAGCVPVRSSPRPGTAGSRSSTRGTSPPSPPRCCSTRHRRSRTWWSPSRGAVLRRRVQDLDRGHRTAGPTPPGGRGRDGRAVVADGMPADYADVLAGLDGSSPPGPRPGPATRCAGSPGAPRAACGTCCGRPTRPGHDRGHTDDHRRAPACEARPRTQWATRGGVVRRVVCREFADPERFETVEEPTPDPGPGEVLVAVEAAAVSFVDGLIARGGYQLRPPLPFTPGTASPGPPGRQAGRRPAHELRRVRQPRRRPGGSPGPGARRGRRGRRGQLDGEPRDDRLRLPGPGHRPPGRVGRRARGERGDRAGRGRPRPRRRGAGARRRVHPGQARGRARRRGRGRRRLRRPEGHDPRAHRRWRGRRDRPGRRRRRGGRAAGAGHRRPVLCAGLHLRRDPEAARERRAAAEPDRRRRRLGRLVAHRARRVAGPGRGRAAPDRCRRAAPGPPAGPAAGRRGHRDPRVRRALRGREARAHALVINPDDGR
ncbi:hypothetical protein L7F22_065756 [Adiantum nelumboides]|nr:hypothetical protein [Adiantum nelumboides]